MFESLKNYSADNYSVLRSLMTMNVLLQINYNTSLDDSKRPNRNLRIMYSAFLTYIYKKDAWFKKCILIPMIKMRKTLVLFINKQYENTWLYCLKEAAM